MIIEGRVGAQTLGDGSIAAPRLGKLGELITGDAVGKYYELARRGQLFMAAMQASAALGTALTATAVTLSLYNPLSSGVNLAMLQCTITLGGAVQQTTTQTSQAYVYAANVGPLVTAPASNTAAIIVPGVLTNNGSIAAGTGGGIGRVYTATTLPAVGIIVRLHPFSVNQAITTAGASSGHGIDYIDGALVLGQGTIVTLQGIATTTGNNGIVSFVWAEIPV